MEGDQSILEAVKAYNKDKKSKKGKKVKNNIQKVVIALQRYPETVNKVDALGRTALILVIDWGHSDVFDLLLQCKSININIQDNYGSTVLMHTACVNHVEMCSKLLQFESVDLELKNNGNTVLMHAFLDGHINIIKLLLKHGARYEGWKNWRVKDHKKQQIHEIMNIWTLPRWSKFIHKGYPEEFKQLVIFYLCLFKRLNIMYEIRIPKEIQQMLISYIAKSLKDIQTWFLILHLAKNKHPIDKNEQISKLY